MIERYLVTNTITYLDPAPWGEGIDLENEKSYIHSRYRTGPKYFAGYAFLWYEFQFALHLVRLYLKNRYRAMAVGRYGIFFPILAKLLRLRTRVVMTDVEFRPGLNNRLYRYALRKADAICSFTSYESNAISGAFGIPRDKFHLVRLAFLAQEIADARDEEYVVAGGVNARDWKTFAEAVDGLPYKIKVLTRHLNVKLPSNVTVNWVSREEYFRCLGAATCVVIPLLPEKLRCTGSTAWTAAMAMGKAVITTGTECAHDYIEDGVSGFVVGHGDALALRRKIQLVMEDAELRRRVGEAARARAWRDWSPEVYRSSVLGVMKHGPTLEEGKCR